LSASKFWLGAEHVRRWREANVGLLATSVRSTGWMFGSLLLSYLAEFLLVWLAGSAAFSRMWIPGATYSPLFACWLWRRVRA
jgi:hypothetical protein